MPTTTKRKTQTELGLGWRHRQAADNLRANHIDGSPCTWILCGRPMWKDRTRNWDYDPESTNPNSGQLQADHSKMSRSEAIRRGLPIPLPDRLLHGECNRQRGDGRNDPGATTSNNQPMTTTERLAMPWPF